MKMKEVTEKTGLTDRAVRLYIDEGLALPNIEESYSGRKSIDFSESNVERLKNVALLRKAGFSIADIKSMVDDNSTSKDIIDKFIEQTESNIAHETEIVEKLKGISFDEDVTLEKICNSLSETVEEKEVPSEDIKLTALEKVLKIVKILLSCTLLAHSVWVFEAIITEIFNVRYLKLTDDPMDIMYSFFYLGWVVVALLSTTVIFNNTGKRFNRKTKGSWFSIILSAIGNIFMYVVTFLLVFCTVTPFSSQTTNPDNYMILDKVLLSELESWDDLDHLYKVFPRKIPNKTKEDYPDSIKYFYEYTPNWDGGCNTYDICAEWKLTDIDYEVFKKNLEENFILENILIEINHMNPNKYILDYLAESAKENSGYNIVQKGDWTLIYYKGYGKVIFDYAGDISVKPDRCKDELNYSKTKDEFDIKNWDMSNTDSDYDTRYDFLICAYNDKERKVRYIASSSITGFGNRKGGPYYVSLDW